MAKFMLGNLVAFPKAPEDDIAKYSVRYKHFKRDTVYRLLAETRLQVSEEVKGVIGPAADQLRVAIYQDIASNEVYVRPSNEFFDAKRFIPVSE